MRKFFAFLPLVCALSLQGQYCQVGNSSILGNGGGPLITNITSNNYISRFAYIYPRNLMGNIRHGDTIESVEFRRGSGGAINSNCNLRIFLRNTSKSDFGSGKLYWPGEISGAVRVYDQNPAAEIGTADGFYRIPFYNQKFRFDTTKGDNLEVLVEYNQTAVQSDRVLWYYENSFTVSGYYMNQTKTYQGTVFQDSLNGSSDAHPTVIFNFPRDNYDVTVLKVYSLGKIPVPLGNPDSVKALVRNVGKKAANATFRTFLKGTNSGLDSTKVNIAVGQQKFINIPSLKPTKKGIDTVYVTGFHDQNPANDTAWSVRLANENVYSYRDITQPPGAGGIGFNGNTGDFVARFFSNKTKAINQVTVNFALSGRPFRVGIWDNTGKNGAPGKTIYVSDSLTTVAGNYILDLKKPITVNGTFFVGVRQLGTNNVAFGYQDEDPVRPRTFFYCDTAGGSTWYDFFPDAPFKFLIEPRLQGDTDLTVISVDQPRDTIDKYKGDTLAPRATIANVGAKDMKDSFEIHCVIALYGKVLYREVLKDTLRSGGRRTYTFPKTFVPKDLGELTVLVYTRHPHDQIRDNDTGQRKFYVGVKSDVMVQQVYDPFEGAVYEYLRDSIVPIATIGNPSYNNAGNFIARVRIFKGSNIVYEKGQVLSLPKFNSKILSWPTYRCLDTGDLTVVFTTEMTGDKAMKNDTAIVHVKVIKQYDIGIDSTTVPDKNKYYNTGNIIWPRFKVYNDGILPMNSALAVCRITSPYTSSVYLDSQRFSISMKETFWQMTTKSFKPLKRGIYTVMFKVQYPGDYVGSNDSVKYTFNVGYPEDYSALQVLYPLPTDTLDVGAGPLAPKMKLANLGFRKNTDLVPFYLQIWWGNKLVYQDIKSVNLDTSQSLTLDMAKTYTPLYNGHHRVIAFTDYSKDANRKNDTALSSFFVKIARDAHPVSIDTLLLQSAWYAPYSDIPFAATIRNEGGKSMGTISTYLQVRRNNTLLHSDFTDDTLGAYQERGIAWSKKFNAPDSGWYDVLIFTSSAADQYKGNDSFSARFHVMRGKDAAPIAWLFPAPGTRQISVTQAEPMSIVLRNDGLDTTQSLSGKVYFALRDSITKAVIFFDSGTYTNLRGQSGVAVRSIGDFFKGTPGAFTAQAWSQSADDVFKENDTTYSTLTLWVNGTKIVSDLSLKIGPVPATDVLFIRSNEPLSHAYLLDVTGRKILSGRIENHAFSIQNIAAGNYTLSVFSATGKMVQCKIVVVK
ncbi:MAG: hypothetical protein JNL57_07770 [Bacteroidetes bacterium]|nr:hypothetical protein [Bacteroidota bacterium]